MIYQTRGEAITFSNTFFDVNGVLATVQSANVTLVFPSSTAAGALLKQSPGQLKGKAILPMSVDANGLWTAIWDSSVSDPGTVFWAIRSSNGGVVAEDGAFVLEGNIANVEIP